MKEKLLKKIKTSLFTLKTIEYKEKEKIFQRNIIEFPRTVGILALNEKKEIILLKQYRFPIKRSFWEIPAGILKKKEKPELGAKRELEEETGFLAKKIEKILDFYPSVGYSSECLSLFRATNLQKGKKHFDEDEKIEKMGFFSLEKVLRMIKEGKIEDAKTIIAVFYEKLFRT